MYNCTKTNILFLVLLLFTGVTHAQTDSKLYLIDNISGLESNKDPKCYATANRLEDFMYGTPLANETREEKVTLQKKLILYIWDKASRECDAIQKDTIESQDLKNIINELSHFGKLKSGDYYFTLGKNLLTVEPDDLRQYSSVAYSLRAMLSVEQDFLFNPTWKLKPITYDAINNIKFFIDLATLASLKLADEQARKENSRFLTSAHFLNAWNKLFEESPQRLFLDKGYPTLNLEIPNDYNYSTLRNIISQKINSYENYNQISLPILLRNIQVYFARHKWPKEGQKSDELKNYLIESLVYLSSDIIQAADKIADSENEIFIRNTHIDKAVNAYLPIKINQFEDVTYFPGIEESITIESYDLDAFRDSGLHWRILEYSLTNLDSKVISELDPFAAEILVESIAQWALLVLRVTGDISRQNQNEKITLKDMEEAFISVQNLIYKYEKRNDPQTQNNVSEIKSSKSNASIKGQVFFEATEESGLDFYHKSSDWLSRKIRSYIVKEDENLIRMAIPPAFGGSGIASEDINNDGYQDLFLAGGMGNKLYLNNQDGTFTDITMESGINTWNQSMQSFSEVRQVIINDFDNDGLQDIFLTLVNENHRLYKNINGEKFKYLPNSNFEGKGKVGGPATAFDYNNDGLLDIYIGYFGNYLNGQLPTLDRNNQNGSPNALFKNNGNFEFEKVKHIKDDKEDLGWTQALVHVDINQDGHQDIIVGNDFGVNAYYINDGNGQFTNKNEQLSTSKPSYTMSIGSADLNNDLYPDLYISNIVVMEKDEKYVNPTGETTMNFDLEKMQNLRTVEANDLFISESENNILKQYNLSESIGRGYSSTGWSWDADFFDFDNDGDDDLYCLNGMNDFMVYGTENPTYSISQTNAKDVVFAQSHREKNVFFSNENGYLKEQSSIIGGDLKSNSRSAVYMDLENDGDLDIIINNYHDKAILLKNKQSLNKNWIKIKLEGDANLGVNRDAIGSVIIVRDKSKSLQIWREIHSTTGYLSVHPKQQHFGIGDSKKVDIEVKWSNGTIQKFTNLHSNSSYNLKIGQQPKK